MLASFHKFYIGFHDEWGIRDKSMRVDITKPVLPEEEHEVAVRKIMRERKYQGGRSRRSKKLIYELDCKTKNILQDIAHVEQQEHDLIARKRQCILTLAENFENICELEEYIDPVHTVDTFIYELVREHGLFVTQKWIREILSEKYKLPMFYLSLYNAHELSELLASSLLPTDYPPPPPPSSSPMVPTAVEGNERGGGGT
jgi:hypothetical protein